MITTDDFNRLEGRGMHELRNDELTPYMMTLASVKGVYSREYIQASEWIVSELERKTNDERKAARYVEFARDDVRQIAKSVDSWKTEAGWQREANQKNFAALVEANRKLAAMKADMDVLLQRNQNQSDTITSLMSECETKQRALDAQREYNGPIFVAFERPVKPA